MGCVSLDSVILPDTTRYIGSHAFKGCSSLTSFTIPVGLEEISEGAFDDCSGLQDFYYNATSTRSGHVRNEVYQGDTLNYDYFKGSSSLFGGTAHVARMTVGEGVRSMMCIWGQNVDTLSLPTTLDTLLTISGLFYDRYITSHVVIRYNMPSGSTLRYVYYNCRNLKNYDKEESFGQLTCTDYNAGVFPGGTGVRHVIIGDSVESLPDFCFRDCYNVREFIYYAIPSNITSIGSCAFQNCNQILTATIPSTVTRMGVAPFLQCDNLGKITYNAHYIGYAGNLPLPGVAVPSMSDRNPLDPGFITSSIRYMGVTAVNDLPSVDTLVIGQGVEHISPCLLGYSWSDDRGRTVDTTGLSNRRVFIDNQSSMIQNIGHCSFAFFTLEGAETLFVDSLRSVGDGAFTFTKGLHNLVLPEGFIELGTMAFGYSHDLDSIVLPQSVEWIGGYCFAFDSSLSYLSFNCENAYTDGMAFANTVSLHSIDFGPNVTTLGDNMFHDAEGLTEVTLNEGLQMIGHDCFAMSYSYGDWGTIDTSHLHKVVLPSSLNSIGNSAFARWKWSFSFGIHTRTRINGTLLDTVICRAATPPILDDSSHTGSNSHSYPSLDPFDYESYSCGSFYECHSYPTRLIIPCGSLSAYMNYSYGDCGVVLWSNFDSIEEQVPYNLTLTVNEDTMGSASYNCLGSSSSGATGITLTAMPAANHHFVQWSDGNTDNPRVLYLTSDTALQAQFAWGNHYQVTAQSANNNRGSVSGSGTFVQNSIDTLVAIPNYGYHFDHWSDGDTNNPRYLTVIANATLTATFLPNQYALNVNSADNSQGSVSGGGTFDYNSNHSITAIPATGYHFTMWNDNVSTNPRSIHITQDTTFTAQFAINVYTLNVSSANNTMGSASASNTQFEHGDTAILTATANYGYHFSQWSDGDTINPRQLQMTHNTTLTAQFVANQYTVSLTTDTIRGSVTGSGNYGYLSVCTLTATANYGYHFSTWSDGNSDNPRTVILTQDTFFTATFFPNEYTLQVLSNDETMGATYGSGTYHYLDTVQFGVYSVAPHHHFTQWDDGSTDSVGQTIIYCDQTITAFFDVDMHNVSLSANNESYGYVYGNGMYFYGSEATIRVQASYGYHFVRWSNGVTDNPYTLHVLHDTSLVAIFAPDLYANLCMVSVENGRNVLVWNSEPTAVSYTVLRESSTTGQYEQLATVAAQDYYTWVDTSSRPVSHSYRYRLRVINEWNETFDGQPHKTMHLTINQGMGGNWNLVWTEYKGTQFVTYIIYRGTNSNDIQEIDRIPVGDNTTYTDENAPVGELYYQVGIVPAIPCSSGKSGDIILSNIANTSGTFGIETVEVMNVNVYPNPTTGWLIVDAENILSVEVFDLSGCKVAAYERTNKIDLDGLPAGNYLLKIHLSTGTSLQRVIKD